jgi:hypothetical protein
MAYYSSQRQLKAGFINGTALNKLNGLLAFLVVVAAFSLTVLGQSAHAVTQSPTHPVSFEYLWYEAENMRGFTTGKIGEPILNPSYLNLGRDKVPGWGINGPGVSAEWTQGGESEWNSAAASADENKATLYQDLEIPREGKYTLWIRYADWANKAETFSVRIAQNGQQVFEHEFGTKDVIDPHDEVSMYWGWAFAWDGAASDLKKGPIRISIEITKAAEARRHIDCFLLTNDLAFKPTGRQKPDFAAARYLRNWSASRKTLASLSQVETLTTLPAAWIRPKLAGRDFLMPWNTAKEFWDQYDKPPAERMLFPFNAEPIDQFVAKYKGTQDVPIFKSKLVVPVIYINNLPDFLKEGSPFLRYLRETKVPFAVLINYGSAKFGEGEGKAAFQLLNGELKDQFLGFISGESVGYVWDSAPAELKISASQSRRQLLEAHRQFYTNAIARKWRETFQTETGPLWDKIIPAQSTSSTSFAHALTEWGVKLIGMETAAVMPMTAMRIAFTRGAARQFGGEFLYYHAPNFGDTATTFTKVQNFSGPDFFYHSRYGPTMGPSLSWYRKSYYLYYMSGASAIYLEQGGDQFFKPGPGENPLQLNPLGRITDEFMRFAEKHPDRGTPYTPVAFLLDPAHGFEMTDYPQWPFEISQIDRGDRALRELFGVAYYPGLVVEGEPAIADRQPFVSSVFGDVFDVITASGEKREGDGATGRRGGESGRRGDGVTGRRGEWTNRTEVNAHRTSATSLSLSPPLPVTASLPLVLSSYRALVVGGRIEWSQEWIQKLTDYVRSGGTVVLNAAQIKGIPEQLLGVRLTNAIAEANNGRCLLPGDEADDLSGQVFRYERLELKGATTLVSTMTSDPLVTVNKVGKGSLIFVAVPDLLGEDERMVPLAAHVLAHVFSNATPVKVSGDVEYLINRNTNGWVVTLLNNNGVFKTQQGMAQVDRTAYLTATISLPGQKIQSAIDWTTDKPIATDGDSLKVRIAPGGIAVVEFKVK